MLSAPLPSASWEFGGLSPALRLTELAEVELLDLTLDCGISPQPHPNSKLASSNCLGVLPFQVRICVMAAVL